MAVQYMTEDSLAELLKLLKQRFVRTSKFKEVSNQTIDEHLKEPLVTDTIAFQDDKSEHKITSSEDYTKALKDNYGSKAKLTDIAPLTTGFSLLSNAKGKRCLGTNDDGTKKSATLETEYSALSLSNEQQMAYGQDIIDMKGATMMLSSGGVTAFSATSDTTGKGKYLSSYSGKESDVVGTEHNTFYAAPDYGMEFRKDTDVGATKTTSVARYAPDSISITAKTLISEKDKESEEKNAPAVYIDGGQIVLKDGKETTKITASGLSLNGSDHGANTQAAEIAKVCGCHVDFYIKNFGAQLYKAGKTTNTILFEIKDSRINEHTEVTCDVPSIPVDNAAYPGFKDYQKVTPDVNNTYKIDDTNNLVLTVVGVNPDDHMLAVELKIECSATYTLDEMTSKLTTFFTKTPLRISIESPAIVNLPIVQ